MNKQTVGNPDLGLSRSVWTKLNHLRTQVGRTRESLYRWKLAFDAWCPVSSWHLVHPHTGALAIDTTQASSFQQIPHAVSTRALYHQTRSSF